MANVTGVASLRVEAQDDLTHFDSVTLGKQMRRTLAVHGCAIHDHRISLRHIRESPSLLLERHLRVQSADCGLVQLDMTVQGPFVAAKRHDRCLITRLSDEADLVADISALDDLEATGHELKRTVVPRHFARRWRALVSARRCWRLEEHGLES